MSEHEQTRGLPWENIKLKSSEMSINASNATNIKTKIIRLVLKTASYDLAPT